MRGESYGVVTEALTTTPVTVAVGRVAPGMLISVTTERTRARPKRPVAESVILAQPRDLGGAEVAIRLRRQERGAFGRPADVSRVKTVVLDRRLEPADCFSG